MISDPVSLLEAVSLAAADTFAFRNCSTALVRRVSSDHSHQNKISEITYLLQDILEYLKQLQSKYFFVNNWMKINHAEKFDEFHGRLNEFSAVKLSTCKTDIDSDEINLRDLMSLAIKDYGALRLRESYVFDDEMVSRLQKIFRKEQTPITVLSEINLLFLKVNDQSMLGKGGFGEVYKASLRNVDVAVKRASENCCNELKKEAVILQLHQFPGVIRVLGVDNADKPTLMVMELAVCSLYSALHDSKHRREWTEQQKIDILLSCAATFAFLHSVGIIHRDISSKNILLMSDGRAKVSDFGASTSRLTSDAPDDSIQGKYAYLAPELILEINLEYTQQTDVYAFGILMNEMMTGKIPYEKRTDHTIFASMYKEQGLFRPELFSGQSGIKECIIVCWNFNPRKRWGFSLLCWELRGLLNDPPFEPDSAGKKVFIEKAFLASSIVSGVYSGDLVGNQRHGSGKLTTLQGTVLNGNWCNNELHGYVETLGKNESYKGEYLYSRRHGQGKCEYSDGAEYDGKWINGKREGHGVYKFPNGSVYDGEWKNGEREGHGVCKYLDGTVYEGEWKNDLKEGCGTEHYPDGTYREMEWKEGMLVSAGLYTYDDDDNDLAFDY